MTQNEAAGLRSEFLTIIDFWVKKLREELGGRMTVTGTDGHSATGTELKFKAASDTNLTVTVTKTGDTVVAEVGVRYK